MSGYKTGDLAEATTGVGPPWEGTGAKDGLVADQAPALVLPRRGPRKRVSPYQVVVSAVLVLAGFVMLLPLGWVLVQSFELPSAQFVLPPVWFPHHLTLESYRVLFSSAPFVANIINSVLITVTVIVGSTVISILAAYAFARLQFPGREVLFIVFLASLTLPTQVSAIPSFVVVKYLHLLNTQASIILPALIQVVGMFLLRQQFRTVPRELDDAAGQTEPATSG